jgi:hypothetical protein
MNGNWGPGVARVVQKESAKRGEPIVVTQRRLIQSGKLIKRGERVLLAPTPGTSKLRSKAESRPRGRYVK